MVTGLLIPKKSATGHSSFLKLGSRKYLVISVAMTAARVETDNEHRITDAALSVGSCSVVAQRLPELEQALIGQLLSDDLCNTITQQHVSSLSPIDDVRSTASYRIDASVELLRRTLRTLVNRS